MSKYQWHGEPVKVEFGYCTVYENKEKPLYWYNFEILWNLDYHKPVRSAKQKFNFLTAIKVIPQKGSPFCIANHFGIGVHKLINGGWPSHRHYSLPLEGFTSDLSRDESLRHVIRKFDLEGFEDHESKRKKWQEENYPIEVAERKQIFGI